MMNKLADEGTDLFPVLGRDPLENPQQAVGRAEVSFALLMCQTPAVSTIE
jgi:hypothetical protein